MLTIEHISYDETIDSYTVDVVASKNGRHATLTMTYSDKPSCRIDIQASSEILNENGFFNFAHLSCAIVSAINNAMTADIDLPCDLQFPINVNSK